VYVQLAVDVPLFHPLTYAVPEHLEDVVGPGQLVQAPFRNQSKTGLALSVTGEPADAARERSDTTAVPAASIVLLAMTSLVLADAVTEKFGADTVREIAERLEAHRAYVAGY